MDRKAGRGHKAAARMENFPGFTANPGYAGMGCQAFCQQCTDHHRSFMYLLVETPGNQENNRNLPKDLAQYAVISTGFQWARLHKTLNCALAKSISALVYCKVSMYAYKCTCLLCSKAP